MSGDYSLKNFAFFKERAFKTYVDSLTGLLSRTETCEYIMHLIGVNVPFSLAIVDIDNFKTVNDTLGHIKGDIVLSETARFLCDKIGSKGVVGRFGGDEFIFVLENITEYDEIWDICHDINMSIGSLAFKDIKGISVTVTMGISRYPVDGQDFEYLLSLADKALYRGKMKGRNCFIIYLAEKHKNIDIRRESEGKYSSYHLCSRVFNYLTLSEDAEEGLAVLFRQFVGYLMVDHVCIQTRKGINFQVIHKLAKNKKFASIDYDMIGSFFNSDGVAYFNKIVELAKQNKSPVFAQMRSQHISSSLYCKIRVFGKECGYIRMDMTDTVRIWQHTEMDMIVIAANLLGVLLHYQQKSLEDLPLREVWITGDD